MFATVTAYNATTSSSETKIIQPALIRHVDPHDDVLVDGSATVCCEVFFSEADSVIVLMQLSAMQGYLQTLTGEIDEYGTPT